MPLLKDIGYLATCRDEGGQGEIHPVRDAAVAWQEGRIAWVGPEKELPDEYRTHRIYSAGGAMVIPGLVDCHTHLAFGGWRPREFALRMQGKSYLEINKEGGGILSTMNATRAATEEELHEKALAFLRRMQRMGVTTVECKSGYGLSTEHELKTLRVYRRLAEEGRQHIVSTFLGAHTLPPEFEDDRGGYLDLVCQEMIPAVAEEGLARFCDVFLEEGAFTREEARRVLTAGLAAGLAPKLHADQLSSCGGAELAGELEAASADHLEQISEEGIAAMAQSGVVGVTLPIASLYTRQPSLDCRRLLEAGVPVAVATDFNPGSAPSYDLHLAMMLSCTQGWLSPAQALKGATLQAARALRMEREVGSVEAGKWADLAVVDAPDPEFWMYHWSPGAVTQVFQRGEAVR
ncbi:MAG: imidazolonepropionase [Balneolaceae bacterium]|nr:imidazolonepropionase [Balneolaceae bacterium]